MNNKQNEVVYKELCNLIRTELGDILNLSPNDIDIQSNFADLGIDSLAAVELENRLQKHLKGKCPVETSVMLNFENIDELARYLTSLIVEK